MSRYKPGDVVRFRRLDGKIATDTVREVFLQTITLEPYARDRVEPALVLTEHSWCRESDVIESANEKESMFNALALGKRTWEER